MVPVTIPRVPPAGSKLPSHSPRQPEREKLGKIIDYFVSL